MYTYVCASLEVKNHMELLSWPKSRKQSVLGKSRFMSMCACIDTCASLEIEYTLRWPKSREQSILVKSRNSVHLEGHTYPESEPHHDEHAVLQSVALADVAIL